MKKTISLLLALVMCLSLCACGGTSGTPETIEGSVSNTKPTNEPATIVPKETEPLDISWVIDYYVDDFGDKTDKTYIKCVEMGDFSNTATTSSNLAVVVFFNPACSNEDYVTSFSFRLLEYTDHLATYSSSEKIILKVKIGDKIVEEKLQGVAPNGDLILEHGNLYKEILKALVLDEHTVRCIIEIGSSKYNFTLSGAGFADTANDMMKTYGYSSYDIRSTIK